MREQEFRIQDQNSSLYYEVIEGRNGKYVCITRGQGQAWELRIPEQVEGYPVKAIGRKAFLSRKNLRRVIVPCTVEEIGDWAFAYCGGLETVVFGSQNIRFGKAVFMECAGLRFLYTGDGDEGTAALLAAAVTAADAPYLLDAREAGSAEWLNKWDARMLAVLHSPDNEGYSKQVLCGEEDYGSTDLNAYESARRRMKVRLLMLRLLYPEGLLPEHREELQQYLKEHTKGCAHEETWRVVLEEHGEDRAWYRMFAELGCADEGNLELLLADIGEGCPEMKAYLLQFKEEKIGYTDFFAGLQL